MGCHGGFSLDEATRRSWFNPEKILEDSGLRSGQVFVDVGCGDGFFTILAARKVGKGGSAFAVDMDAAAIERLNRKTAENNLSNVKAIVGRAEDTVFCEKCADIVFYSIVLHDFLNPAKVLLNAKRMLKSPGRLIDLDWKKKQTSQGPPVEIRFSEKQAQKLIEAAGFRVESVKDAGYSHYVIIANL